MVLGIGLDATDIGLIERFVSQGHLPFYKKILEEGSVTKVFSFASISSGSTWPSLTTGVNPGIHGMSFSHRQIKNGTYQIEKRHSDQINAPYFWEHKAFEDKKICLVDLPKTIPIRKNNITSIHGWGYESWGDDRSSHPEHLLQELISKHGEYGFVHWYQSAPNSKEEWSQMTMRIIDSINKRKAILADLLMRDAYDLFLGSINETHICGHYYFHGIQKNHPQFNDQIASNLEKDVLRILQATEDLISHLYALRPEAKLLIFSNSGMGPNFSGTHLLDPILEKLGYKKPSRKLIPNNVNKIERLLGAKNIGKIKKIVPLRMWEKFTRKIVHGDSTWKDSIAFALPSDQTGNIRFNLKGREPMGKISLEEYDGLCAQITADLLPFKNLETDKPLITQVIRIKDIVKGDRINELPDLAVVWANDAPVNKIYSEKTGTIEGSLVDKRTGSHLPYGFFAIKGEKIESKSQTEYKLEDIASTILHHMNMPIPKELEGEIIKSSPIKVWNTTS